MDLLQVRYQCPDIFVCFIVASHNLQDPDLGSVLILDPFTDSWSFPTFVVQRVSSVRSSDCELSSKHLSLPHDSTLSGFRVHPSLGIVSFPSASLCPISLLSNPESHPEISACDLNVSLRPSDLLALWLQEGILACIGFSKSVAFFRPWCKGLACRAVEN